VGWTLSSGLLQTQSGAAALFLVGPLPLFRTPTPRIDAQQSRRNQSRFRSHKTPRSRKKECSSSSSGSDPDAQNPGIDQAAGSNAVATSDGTFLPAPITNQTVCKLPQPGPTVTVWGVLVLLGFGCRSSQRALATERSGRSDEAIGRYSEAGRSGGGRREPMCPRHAGTAMSCGQVERQEAVGQSKRVCFRAWCDQARPTRQNSAGMERARKRSSSERETETDRESTARKKMQGNPSRVEYMGDRTRPRGRYRGRLVSSEQQCEPARAPGSLCLCL